MPDTTFEVAVIGGGQAGLAVSYFLNQYGMHHIVLERGRIGQTWRTQRWDSFMLNSPNRFNVLPGDIYRGTNPDGFDSAGDFVSYLEDYAKRFDLPVQEQAGVISVERNSSTYHVTALVDGTTRMYTCRRVVVASGAMNTPKVPSFAKSISRKIRQYHAGGYRGPSELPEGAVLVVGSAQSGLQVAEDLIEAGRRVYLSTSAVGRIPRRYRGKDILEWLLNVGFYDVKTEDVTDPKDFELRQPQVSGVGPLGHTVSLQALAGRGAVVIGRVDGATDGLVSLRSNAADHIRFADEVSHRVKTLIERFIAENHVNAPPAEFDPADEPDTNAACASSMKVLDLERENVRSIIWTTGFTADFGYLKSPAVDRNGRPIHRQGISNEEGLYFLGLPWLRKRKSTIINGMVEDSAFIAENVRNASPR